MEYFGLLEGLKLLVFKKFKMEARAYMYSNLALWIL